MWRMRASRTAMNRYCYSEDGAKDEPFAHALLCRNRDLDEFLHEPRYAEPLSMAAAGWFTRSASSLLGLNTATILAAIVIAFPVCGFRPCRSFLEMNPA